MANKKFKFSPTARIEIAPFWMILTVIVVGASTLFLYMYSIKGIGIPKAPAQIEDPKIQELQNLNDADDVATIEKDLNSTDVEGLDAGLDQAVRDSGI